MLPSSLQITTNSVKRRTKKGNAWDEAATSFALRNVFSRFSFVLWLFLLEILDEQKQEKLLLLPLPGIQFWLTIFSVIFPYNFQYLSCQRQSKQILGKKPVQDSTRKTKAAIERETAAVRARQIDINMACRVMDPLKCTTIAVKSKNASAFVFIVP